MSIPDSEQLTRVREALKVLRAELDIVYTESVAHDVEPPIDGLEYMCLVGSMGVDTRYVVKLTVKKVPTT